MTDNGDHKKLIDILSKNMVGGSRLNADTACFFRDPATLVLLAWVTGRGENQDRVSPHAVASGEVECRVGAPGQGHLPSLPVLFLDTVGRDAVDLNGRTEGEGDVEQE